MVAAFDHQDATLIIVAAIGAIGTLIVGVLNYFSGMRGRARLERHVDTFNNKTAGETIHDMAQTVEVVSGQVHAVDRKLQAHLDEVDPLMKRAIKEWGDGG